MGPCNRWILKIDLMMADKGRLHIIPLVFGQKILTIAPKRMSCAWFVWCEAGTPPLCTFLELEDRLQCVDGWHPGVACTCAHAVALATQPNG